MPLCSHVEKLTINHYKKKKKKNVNKTFTILVLYVRKNRTLFSGKCCFTFKSLDAEN